MLCEPEGLGPAPGVLLLGGSEGGMHERDALALAGHGFTVLALAYFGRQGVAPGLVDIPLEHFFGGLDMLAASGRAGERFGVLGGSRGGEAALLVAAHNERVGAAVSVVGSGVVTAGIDYRRGRLLEILGAQPNSWTLGGDPIPGLGYEIGDDLRELVARGRPVPLTLAFPAVPVGEDLERVSIPIERTSAAVLLLCASDDRSWPSLAYSRVAAQRLRAHHRPVEQIVYDGAGHLIAGPPGGTIMSTTTPGPGVTFEMGGSPAATTAARQRAWQATVDFFTDQLL